MPPITAFLHTENDALRLGRVLETLRSCDEILIVDHGSRDGTCRIAREYGARVFALQSGDLPGSDLPSVDSQGGASPAKYLSFARHAWVLCLEAHESVSDGLEASLLEWKLMPPAEAEGAPAFSIVIREETASGWLEHPTPQTRLVPRSWTRWQGHLPADEPSAIALQGELLRFILP
jgi:hypothetical protein